MRRIWFRLREVAAASAGKRLLLCETLVALSAASLAIRLLPFRTVMSMAERAASGPAPASTPRQAACARVRWSVATCARHLPWRPLCFPQGLAAQWMLHRRRVPSVLFYGAAPDAAKGLAAHVWVCDRDVPVVGGRAAEGMAVLARFPAGRSGRAAFS
ncbi:MAG: lasso peptide biosynthesis B2 protein [Rhizomicrobium sp.]